jgi:hypothetical protein
MEQVRGRQELHATSARQEYPPLQQLPYFSTATPGLVVDCLAHLRARHNAPSVQEATIRALSSCAVNRSRLAIMDGYSQCENSWRGHEVRHGRF